jgi:hypothetical protein
VRKDAHGEPVNVRALVQEICRTEDELEAALADPFFNLLLVGGFI